MHPQRAHGDRDGVVDANHGCLIKQLSHRIWLALDYTLALFNLLVQGNTLPVDANGNEHLSIAQFSL